MIRFNSEKYHRWLEEESKKLNERAKELKAKIGQEEGAAQSWSRPAQKAMEQDLEVVLVQLALVEQKLKELKTLLKRRKTPADKVALGSVVTVRVNGEEEVFMIAGCGDPRFGVLSADSPVGQALVGKRQGERVQVETSNGKEGWEILRIE